MTCAGVCPQPGGGLQGFGAAVGRVTQGMTQGVSGAVSGAVNGAMNGVGVVGAVVKRQHQHQPRESTTNVHDWVWLGRATLERGSGSGHLVPATTNSSARSGPPLNINNNPVQVQCCHCHPAATLLPPCCHRSTAGYAMSLVLVVGLCSDTFLVLFSAPGDAYHNQPQLRRPHRRH